MEEMLYDIEYAFFDIWVNSMREDLISLVNSVVSVEL